MRVFFVLIVNDKFGAQEPIFEGIYSEVSLFYGIIEDTANVVDVVLQSFRGEPIQIFLGVGNID